MAVRIIVEGIVQGVGYRAWMLRQAEVAGLRGWVRNLEDGRVEAWLEGPSETVETVIDAAQSGPRSAQVERVSRQARPDHPYVAFEIRPTVANQRRVRARPRALT